ncbi:hypothetical protein [Robertkochia sediminum]|uniref:hypothetical protein n=1 Tax=Robertkochia sediminum TaxID=2785326 RepID=UPI001932E139|nr:hypothetical protein [Robertkochia sediminum]MBL7471301.1 hypothetical protein [Robertkochia sediminum]
MRTLLSKILVVTLSLTGLSMFAQQRDLSNFRAPDQRGLHVFEAPKDSVQEFDGVKVRVGGSSTLQFQGLSHENAWENAQVGDAGIPDQDALDQLQLIGIESNFNLATANLDLDVQLAKGLRMHLRTYLSSRHHPEPYVKGGYFLIDDLGFISEGFMENLMKYVTIKIGHMENNYGDAHFRRSDNSAAIYNPFVGNLIMDAFTTEVGAEVYYRRGGFIGMLGVSNGKLNQSVVESDTKPSFLAKLGYDNYATGDDFRFRLTGSVYTTSESSRTYLYAADRAGSRYYLVLESVKTNGRGGLAGTNPTNQFRSGRFDPGFSNELTSFMFNPFLKKGGLEFFGTVELSSGKSNRESATRNATQLAGELIYRFGTNDDIYVGTRYNTVNAELGSGDVDINRFNLSAGYFFTKNILAKLEYVSQNHDGDGYAGTKYQDGSFNGIMMEAVISF